VKLHMQSIMDNTPFCFMLTSEYKSEDDLPETHRKQLAIEGKTLGVDFCIGNMDFLGKGIASTTLVQFMAFISEDIEPETRRFFIDPSINNPKAIHVYEKAGFKRVGEFTVEDGFFENSTSVLLIKDM